MKIDTLILSGCAEKSISFVGGIYALYRKRIIKKKFKNIKEIICVSGGALIITAFLILLFNNYNIEQIIKILLKSDTNPKFNLEDIDDIINSMGLYKNDSLVYIHKYLINIFYSTDDLSLKELYERIPIKISYKILNLTKNKIEYKNYENDPHFSLLNILKATSCIPLVFKPIYYRNNYYIDGGTYCSIPVDYTQSEKYIVLLYKSKKEKIYPNITILEYIKKLIETQVDPIIYNYHIKNNQKIIYIKFDKTTDLFNDVNDKKYMIEEGYRSVINHLTS